MHPRYRRNGELRRMKTCNSCGGFVTPDFVRVFGSEEGEIYGCPDCVPNTALYGGVAARGP
ncbi:Zinc finger protein [Halanaeroarchaeum sp. HSR-CO]|nr:Zinc finger protein [Halanaeroarchaeum sp. HSR-CO]